MFKMISIVAVAGLVLALAPAAQAEEVITTPGDGYDGPYRLMFTTNANHNALSTNINDYNTIVNNVANNLDGWSGSQLESLGATWTCVGSTEDVDARDNTNTHPGVDPWYPIYNLRGEKLANDYADFWDGSFISSREVRPTHDGTTNNDNVWTGSINGGVQDPDYPLGAVNVRQGIPFGGYPRWQYNQEKPPGSNWWLYGISDPITPTYTWVGGIGAWKDSDWDDGGGAVAPPNDADMVIAAATGDFVTVDEDFKAGAANGPAANVTVGIEGGGSDATLLIGAGFELGATGTVDVHTDATLTVNGALTAGTGVTVASGGTLGGSGTITGAVTVESGGTVAPGASIGTLSVTGSVVVGGTYAVEVSGSGTGINPPPVAGTNNDSLAVTGDVTVGAMGLDLVWLVGDKIGGDGDGKFGGEYTIVTGTTVTGSPANVTVNSFVAKFPDGSTVDLWDSYYHDVTGPSGPSDVLVTVGPADPFTDKVTVTLPHVLRGDSTLDGRVMMNDALPIILNWQKTVPAGTGWELGNFNFDDKIMMNDALEIVLSWGQKTDADPPGPNPAAAATASVDRATAVYDAATGFIWLEVNSALAYLQIIDPTGTGQLGPKDPDNEKPYVGFHPLNPLNLLEDQRPHHVGEMDFGGLPLTVGPHMYVEAIPGILEEDFDLDLYTAALDWTEATVKVQWTPEPATMTLLLMGGAVVLARRRRRK